MKKAITIILMCAMTAIAFTGCGKNNNDTSGNNKSETSASAQTDVSKSDSSTTSGSFPYQSLDVKKFDKSKFDGKVKFTDSTIKQPKESKILGTFDAPIKASDIAKYNYKITSNYVDLNTEADKAEEDGELVIIKPNKGWMTDNMVTFDSNKKEIFSPYSICFYNFSDKDINPKEALQKNWISFEALDTDHEIYVGNIIDVNDSDARVNDGTKQYELLIDTLGNPSTILLNYTAQKNSGITSATYVYKYDKCVLEFDIHEKNNGNSKIERFCCETPEEYNLTLEIRKNKENNPLESVIE